MYLCCDGPQYACEYDPETKLAELPHIGPAEPPGKSKAAHETDGHYLCSRLIERSAQYDYDWTAGLLQSRYRSIVWSGSTITYTGNEIKMQNGFGAWRRMSYACEYDTRTGVAGIIRLQ